MTTYASWSCQYFQGANIEFTGSKYGLWTLEDTTQRCQLWDVLFFSFELGPQLVTARVFSMASMLFGLGLVATLAQASQQHWVSWGLGLCFVILFLISVTTTYQFNVWVIFWLWTYCVMVLLSRWFFVHPVPRHISIRGVYIISGLCILCFVSNLMTLVVLRSNYCTCENISSTSISEGRDPGEPCNGMCHLERAGYTMVLASAVWLAAAFASFFYGVQPTVLKENPKKPREWYSSHPLASIASTTISASVTASVSPSVTLSVSASATNHTRQVDSEHKMDESELEEVDADELDEVDSNEIDDSDKKQESGQDHHQQQQHQQQQRQQQQRVLKRRSWGQIFCCDFRVKPRTPKEKLIFYSFRIFLCFGFGIYVFVIVLLSGSRYENTRAANEPSTAPFFTTPQVCAYNADRPNEPWQTFAHQDEARKQGFTIAHCGNCGSCSDPHNTIVYVETRETVADRAKNCGVHVFLGSYNDLVRCLEHEIGFTTECTNCWADNMINTGKTCLFTCVFSLFSGFMENNNVAGTTEGWLNHCLYCDEKMSGPEFVTCSGVARRRLGIYSEIERNPEQQCQRMDVDWATVDFSEIGFDKNNNDKDKGNPKQRTRI